MFKQKPEDGNVVKSIFLAYFILIFHVVLLAVLGLLVLLFSGILNYLIWILLIFGGALAMSGYLLVRYLRRQSGSLAKILSSPEFAGRNVEVNLMGGFASVKISGSDPDTTPRLTVDEPLRRLEDPEAVACRELEQLANLLEKDLITREEYLRAKQKLLGR